MRLLFYIFFIASIFLWTKNTCSQTFKTERSNSLSELRVENELAAGKYSFEDLYEGAVILFEKNELDRSQTLFELASQIQPKNLKIYKYLAQIYERTGQQVRLGVLANAISSFLLPEGENDEFYETMLISSIVLNSRKKPREAFKIFLKLKATLRDKPGKIRKIVKTLEKKAHFPFLAEIYMSLLKKDLYDEFKWGELGDYFLYRGEKSKARKFLEFELEHEDFEPRFLYSYALILFNQREFPMSQVYINLGLKLNDDPLVIRKLKELQTNLSEYIYDVGTNQVRKEAELLFKYGRKDLGIKRMEELVLLSSQDSKTYFEIGRLLLQYPRNFNTWSNGRDYLVRYSQFDGLSFTELLSACELLFIRSMFEDMASILKTLEQRFPKKSRSSNRMQTFKSKVLDSLKDSIRLFETHSSKNELRQYLYLLIDFDPYLRSAYVRLGELIEDDLKREKRARSLLSNETMKTTDAFLSKLEKQGLRRNPKESQLHYLRGKLTTYYPMDKRQLSAEIASFKRALELKPSHHMARLALAGNYHQLGFYRQSVKVLEPLVISKKLEGDEQYRKDAIDLYVKNNIQSASNAYSNENYFLVLEYMLKALELNNNKLVSLDSTLWLGYAYFYSERHEQNIELLEQALDIYGEESELCYLMALSKEGLYKLEEAIIWYDKVIKIGPPENLFVQECVKNMENLQEIIKYGREEQEL